MLGGEQRHCKSQVREREKGKSRANEDKTIQLRYKKNNKILNRGQETLAEVTIYNIT